MMKRKQVAAALLAAVLLTVLTWLATGAWWRAWSPSAAANSPESAVPDFALTRRGTPLDCRLVRLGAAERRASVGEHLWFRELLRKRPALVTPRLFDNPLVASHEWAKVEIENTSGKDYAVSTNDSSYLFWTWVAVTDSAGKPVSFGGKGAGSLKRIGQGQRISKLG